MPFDTLAQIEDVGRIIRYFPTFGEIGLDTEGARQYVPADFMPQKLTVHEAQRRMCLETTRQMGVEVRRIIAARVQDTSALRRSRFSTPDRGRAIQGPGGQRDTSSQAGMQQMTTAHLLSIA